MNIWKMETIHKIFACLMGIIPKVKKHNREKEDEKWKCYVNSLARMESACVLREGLMSFMYPGEILNKV